MKAVLYMGFRNPKTHKRGVENVIAVQARSLGKDTKAFYVFFDEAASVFRWENMVCIAIKKGPLRFLRLNLFVEALLKRRSTFRVLIHSHNYLMSAFLWRRTDLLTVHDGYWYLNKCFERSFLWLFWAIERIVYLRTSLVQCNSLFTYQASQLPSVNRKARIVYCSTPLEKYDGNRSEQQTRPSAFTVFTVRSIEPRAAIDLVVDTAGLAQAEGWNARFVVAGKGPLSEHYKRKIRDLRLTNIEFIGFVPDSELSRRYSECDCVLISCEYGEGFGLPIIEGYYFGKPVVASNRCAIPEVIIDPKYLVANEAPFVYENLRMVEREKVDGNCFKKYYFQRFSNSLIENQFYNLYKELFDCHYAEAR
jgi:glycosyltransferase involved in cell wall biosynthesis